MFGLMNTPTHRRKASSGQFYFVAKSPGHSESVRDANDNVDVIETPSKGDFRPKPVNRNPVSQMESMRIITCAFGVHDNTIFVRAGLISDFAAFVRVS